MQFFAKLPVFLFLFCAPFTMPCVDVLRPYQFNLSDYVELEIITFVEPDWNPHLLRSLLPHTVNCFSVQIKENEIVISYLYAKANSQIVATSLDAPLDSHSNLMTEIVGPGSKCTWPRNEEVFIWTSGQFVIVWLCSQNEIDVFGALLLVQVPSKGFRYHDNYLSLQMIVARYKSIINESFGSTMLEIISWPNGIDNVLCEEVDPYRCPEQDWLSDVSERRVVFGILVFGIFLVGIAIASIISKLWD